MAATRIGCIEYLNAKPLIHGCERHATFETPAALAHLLSIGKLDVALVPIYELLREPHYLAVDGVSISSFGPVFSVFMAYRGELEEIRNVKLDSASITSNQLLRCLLRKFEQLEVEFTTSTDFAEARLLIGDQAIRFRHEHGDSYRYYDLGEQWTRYTGLPFVYALWLIRPEVDEPAALASKLREICARGVENIPAIAAAEPNSEFARWYLSECLRFELGDAEKQSINEFATLLADCGLRTDGLREFRFL